MASNSLATRRPRLFLECGHNQRSQSAFSHDLDGIIGNGEYCHECRCDRGIDAVSDEPEMTQRRKWQAVWVILRYPLLLWAFGIAAWIFGIPSR